MKKIIGFFSGKGGTGKTTCAINTALAIHQLGQKTMLLDCDLENANLALHLGFFDFPVTLHDVLDKEINILEAVHIHSSGLRFIPASISLRRLDSDVRRLRDSLDELDYITILDCPPGIDHKVISLLNVCDEVVVITNPNIPAVTDALRLIQTALDVGKNEISIVVNMSGGKHELSVQDIEETCKVPVLGTIPTHQTFKKSLHFKTPLLLNDPYNKASINFKKIGSSLVGKEYNPPRMIWMRKLMKKF